MSTVTVKGISLGTAVSTDPERPMDQICSLKRKIRCRTHLHHSMASWKPRAHTNKHAKLPVGRDHGGGTLENDGGKLSSAEGDLLAPFAAKGEFQQLTVEACEMVKLPDAAWTEYQRDGNKAALVTKHVLFFRSILVPSLESALVRVRAGHAEALGAFGDQLEQRLNPENS